MSVETETLEITKLTRVILQFGPPAANSGMRAGEYFQVTIDPNMASPEGDYIRFGMREGDEIQGWQRIASMTICEVLGESGAKLITDVGYTERSDASVTMKAITKA